MNTYKLKKYFGSFDAGNVNTNYTVHKNNNINDNININNNNNNNINGNNNNINGNNNNINGNNNNINGNKNKNKKVKKNKNGNIIDSVLMSQINLHQLFWIKDLENIILSYLTKGEVCQLKNEPCHKKDTLDSIKECVLNDFFDIASKLYS